MVKLPIEENLFCLIVSKKNNYNYSSSASYNSVQNTYSGNDVYIINGVSHTIYYTDGIEYNGKTYYRLSEKYTLINE